MLDLETPREETSRLRLLLKLGDAHWDAGELHAAKEAFRRAVELAERIGTPAELARAALGFGGYEMGFVGGAVDDALIGTLAVLDPQDSALRAEVTARLSQAFTFSTAHERKVALARDAVAMARRVADRTTPVRVLSSARWATWSPDNIEERLTLAREIAEIARETGDPTPMTGGGSLAVGQFLEVGDIEAAWRSLEVFARRAEALRRRYPLWLVTVSRGMLALLEGRFDEAQQYAEQGSAFASPNASQFSAVQMVFVRLERGGLEELVDGIDMLARQSPTIPAWRCGLAWVCGEVGREADARRELDNIAADDFVDIPHDMFWLTAMWCLSGAIARLRDRRRAETLYDLLRPYADRCAVSLHS